MVYIADDPWLDDDAIGSVKTRLVVPVEDGRDGSSTVRFDFTLVPA